MPNHKTISNALLELNQLQIVARSLGLNLCGALQCSQAESALGLARPHLERWQEAGFAGDMLYMQRSSELYSSFQQIHPETKSVLTFLAPYSAGEIRAEKLAPGFGRVARYAWGRDYHRVLKKMLSRFVQAASELLPKGFQVSYRTFADAVPLLERTLAAQAQLGFIGKNGLLIRPGLGSYTFISEILWNVDLSIPFSDVTSKTIPGEGCGSCERCLSRCPTNAFEGPGVLNAKRCISYLTIEKKSEFSDWEAEAIGDWVFGCDVCQEVCPFNHSGVSTVIQAEFQADAGSGQSLELRKLFALKTQDAFLRTFAGTALMRAGRENILRNACAVAANTRQLQLVPALEALLETEEILRIRVEAERSIQRLQASSSHPESAHD